MKISKTEIKNKKLNKNTLVEAVRHVRETGFVVFEKTMTKKWTNKMREAWDGHLENASKGSNPKHQDQNQGLLSMPFLDPLAIENPWGFQVIEEMMGKDFWGRLPYHCNSTPPNWPETQDIHRDQRHLFSEIPISMPPHMMIIHVPLVDFTEENGSTEVWPGTHLVTDHTETVEDKDGNWFDIDRQTFEERSTKMLSMRTNMPAGSTLVRDMRIWHRAMPNKTSKRRTMLSLVYHRHFPSLGYQYKSADILPSKIMNQLSKKSQHIYRFNKEEFHKNGSY